MNTSPKYDFPWDLIAGSLTGSLTAEEDLQLQQWLSSNPDNKKEYLQIQELWNNGMEDYKFYQEADENKAWKALHSKLGKGTDNKPGPIGTERGIIHSQFKQRPKLLRNLLAVAAIFLGLIVFGTWFILTKNNPAIYETASNTQRKVILEDGSIITLQPGTKVEIAHNYNKTSRTVTMVAGIAYFEVEHHADKAFIVELGTTQIKDIGTSFTIHKDEKEINVAVSSGKVAFVKLATSETKELAAGSSLSFNVQDKSFGSIKSAASSQVEQLLDFKDTPLADAIISIQKVYRKKIIINDHIAQRKITAHLGGMPYDDVLKVVCKSLGLECVINDSIYILLEQKNEQH
jgi:transmembrane sensor